VVEETMMYVVTGPPAVALSNFRYNDLIGAANGIIPLVHQLTSRFQRLLHAGEPRTVNTAHTVSEFVPRLAPPPRLSAAGGSPSGRTAASRPRR
jgi:hypothetical protein